MSKPEVVGEDVGVHERAAALGEDIDCLLEELNFDPGHVVLLHFLHLLTHGGVQLMFELKRLHVVHVSGVGDESNSQLMNN